MSESQLPEAAGKTWPDYRAVWRWHFYASLFCIPFVVILSISGGVYLFKEEVEDWQDRPYDQLILQGKPAAAADQIRAALDSLPGSVLEGYELPKASNAASRVIVRQGGRTLRVYVHPETLRVLHQVGEDDRFMHVIRQIHGELLAGERGSMVVELAASWTIIMIVTGLYLWWPRRMRGLGGVLYPRMGGGSRMFWRDLHAVTGVWICSLALFLLLSGLPWAKSWGNYLKMVRRLSGTASAKQDWSVGGKQPSENEMEETSGEHRMHNHQRGKGRRGEKGTTPKDLSAVDRIVTAIQKLELPPPVVISTPRRGSADWTVKSLTANRPRRVDLLVNGATGTVVSRQGFWDRQRIDQIVAIGVAAHEGRLFGWPNQALGLLTVVGLDLLCVSGIVLWWKRRDKGVLGAPDPGQNPTISFGLICLVALLGIYLPLFGTSLLAVVFAEKHVLSRIPRVRKWLGLRGSAAAAESRSRCGERAR